MKTAQFINLRPFIGLAVGFSALALVIVCWASGTDSSESWEVAKKLSMVVTADLIAWEVFRRWVWRWRWLRPWLLCMPDLNGEWEGEIRPNGPGSTGEQSRAAPIPASLCIHQTLTSLRCVVRTSEMTSKSFSTGFRIDPETEGCELSYCYESLPRASVRERSAPHFGASLLEHHSENPSRLTGEYWTSRRSTGEMEFRQVSCKAGRASVAEVKREGAS